MKPAALGTPGKVRVVVTLPSVDTPVCDVQTHQLGETPALAPDVERIAVSADLPYAMRRFKDESGLQRVTFLSDYREHAFAKAVGLQLARNGLLARSVIVLDEAGVVRHLQVVPEIIQLPDMAKAFEVANSLAR